MIKLFKPNSFDQDLHWIIGSFVEPILFLNGKQLPTNYTEYSKYILTNIITLNIQSVIYRRRF